MAFTAAQKDYLRTVMGYPKLFSSANAVFENVMIAIDALVNDPSDAGATEAAVINIINQLQALEVTIANNSQLMLATQVREEVKFDAIRNDAYLRGVVGPALIHQLAIRFSMNPAEDYFARPEIGSGGTIKMHRLV